MLSNCPPLTKAGRYFFAALSKRCRSSADDGNIMLRQKLYIESNHPLTLEVITSCLYHFSFFTCYAAAAYKVCLAVIIIPYSPLAAEPVVNTHRNV